MHLGAGGPAGSFSFSWLNIWINNQGGFIIPVLVLVQTQLIRANQPEPLGFPDLITHAAFVQEELNRRSKGVLDVSDLICQQCWDITSFMALITEIRYPAEESTVWNGDGPALVISPTVASFTSKLCKVLSSSGRHFHRPRKRKHRILLLVGSVLPVWITRGRTSSWRWAAALVLDPEVAKPSIATVSLSSIFIIKTPQIVLRICSSLEL